MRLSPSIFTFAQPLASARLSSTFDSWAAEGVMLGKEINFTNGGNVIETKRPEDHCYNGKQTANPYTQRDTNEIAPDLPILPAMAEQLTNERRSRFT